MIGGLAQQNQPASMLIELSVANALASQLFDRELARVGLPLIQAGLLTLVSMHGPTTTTRLVFQTGLASTTLRERLQGLESEGYVERLPNPADGRSRLIGVTPKGKTYLRRIVAVLARVEDDIGAAMGTPIEELRARLERLRLAEQSLIDPEGTFTTG